MPSPTRFKVQQFPWGFRTYDSYTEEPDPGEIARFDVNEQKAGWIEDGGQIRVVDGELVVTIPFAQEPV